MHKEFTYTPSARAHTRETLSEGCREIVSLHQARGGWTGCAFASNQATAHKPSPFLVVWSFMPYVTSSFYPSQPWNCMYNSEAPTSNNVKLESLKCACLL